MHIYVRTFAKINVGLGCVYADLKPTVANLLLGIVDKIKQTIINSPQHFLHSSSVKVTF